MKNIVRASIILAGLWLTLLTAPSCKKTVTKTVTDTLRHAWQQVPYYNSYISQAFSSYNLGDTILAVGGSSYFVHIPIKTFNNQFGYPLRGTSMVQPAYGPVYIDGAGISYTTATTLYVTSNPPRSQLSLLSYTPQYTPGEYSRFAQIDPFSTKSWPAASYPLVRDRYVLTPVETIGAGNRQVRFDLVSFDSTKLLSALGSGDTAHVKQLTVTADPSTLGFVYAGYWCAAYYNKFFVYYGGQFFRVDTTGNVKVFGYAPVANAKNFGIGNIFIYNNTLFVNSGGIFFSSTDQGETWTLFNDLTNTNAGRVVYRTIGNDLYATLDDLDEQLWKVTITGTTFTFTEFNNDGLQSNPVTSLTRCGRYVFATTPSGIFYRDTSLFNQPKPTP